MTEEQGLLEEVRAKLESHSIHFKGPNGILNLRARELYMALKNWLVSSFHKSPRRGLINTAACGTELELSEVYFQGLQEGKNPNKTQ